MIGGDVLISEMKMKHSHSGGSTMLFIQESESSSVSSSFKISSKLDSLNYHRKSFFQIFNLLLKASIATDPFLVGEIYHCGYLWCLIIALLFVAFTQISFYLFVQSWIYGRAYSYNSIWRELFGQNSCSWIALILVIITYITFTIWYQHEIHFHITGILTGIWSEVPSILTNKWFVTYVITLIFVFPPLFVSRLTNFVFLSMFSNVCLLIGIVCLIVYYFHFTLSNDIQFSVTAKESGLKMFNTDIFLIFNAIGVMNSALFYNPILSVSGQDLSIPTISRVMSLTWMTSLTSLVVHLVGGFFSYLINPDNEGDVIFYDMSAYNEDHSKIIYPEVIIGQIATFCISICSNIFYTHFVSRQVAELVLPTSANSLVPVVFSGIVVILFSSGMNFIDETATDIADMIAGVISIILAYVFPSIFYIRQYKFFNKVFGILSVFMIVIGIIVAIITLVCGIIDF
ncbi:hypothetical protein M9Y10_015172 [Tritrichomonas musculus]|uniref:Transmembrane amino acid transporter protein n=1 Tax=Tritrichomonas musculus TaxID=1915356 RepID=A0ABR2L1K7_9EUKA